jgi:hypothetical protein
MANTKTKKVTYSPSLALPTVRDPKPSTRQCPFCKEDIKADAIRCKHCQATIPIEKPRHGGTCPFCKEKIHKEAIRCMHCKMNLASVELLGCWVRAPRLVLPRTRVTAPGGLQLRQAETDCAGCPPNHPGVVQGQAVIWTLINCTETDCEYEAQGIA